jgi:hypothetical protein
MANILSCKSVERVFSAANQLAYMGIPSVSVADICFAELNLGSDIRKDLGIIQLVIRTQDIMPIPLGDATSKV